MPSIPRIVVVDAARDVAPIVRGALALLNRPCILIEVPSSDDALAEVSRSEIDLMVTAYTIPGMMNGFELATRVSREFLATPVIVLAQEDDPTVDVSVLGDAAFQYFMRPVGEPFVRGLRIALDGEAAVADEAPAAGPAVDLGPVPAVDTGELATMVVDLMRDAGAMSIILADRTGRVLIERGATGYIDRETLAAVLGPMFARSAEIGPLVGGHAWTMHYYNGERLDVYGLALGVHYILCLVFEGTNRRAMAPVMLYGRRTADQIIEMLGEAAYSIKKVEPAPAPKAESRPAARKQKADDVPAAKPSRQSQKQGTSAASLEAMFDAQPEPAGMDPVADFDADALFGQAIDEELAESMFDTDALSDLADSISHDEGQRVGWDEAIDMGIIDEQ
ncbi:MAG: response regulator [Anaerolineae bacterium]|nr:response regulator [Anaerolineae bacterium]